MRRRTRDPSQHQSLVVRSALSQDGQANDADVGLSVGGVKYLDSGVTVANIRGSGAVERLIRTGLTVGLGYDLGRVTSARGDGRLETDTHELTLTGRIAPSASRSTSIVVSAIPTLARRRVSGESLCPLCSSGYGI